MNEFPILGARFDRLIVWSRSRDRGARSEDRRRRQNCVCVLGESCSKRKVNNSCSCRAGQVPNSIARHCRRQMTTINSMPLPVRLSACTHVRVRSLHPFSLCLEPLVPLLPFCHWSPLDPLGRAPLTSQRSSAIHSHILTTYSQVCTSYMRICVCPSLRTRTRNQYTTVVVGKKAERNNININIRLRRSLCTTHHVSSCIVYCAW